MKLLIIILLFFSIHSNAQNCIPLDNKKVSIALLAPIYGLSTESSYSDIDIPKTIMPTKLKHKAKITGINPYDVGRKKYLGPAIEHTIKKMNLACKLGKKVTTRYAINRYSKICYDKCGAFMPKYEKDNQAMICARCKDTILMLSGFYSGMLYSERGGANKQNCEKSILKKPKIKFKQSQISVQ